MNEGLLPTEQFLDGEPDSLDLNRLKAFWTLSALKSFTRADIQLTVPEF